MSTSNSEDKQHQERR